MCGARTVRGAAFPQHPQTPVNTTSPAKSRRPLSHGCGTNARRHSSADRIFASLTASAGMADRLHFGHARERAASPQRELM
jgi:hypothetical protein